MVERAFADPRLARLYDPLCSPGRTDLAFYLPLVTAARSVLDVGCGTGELLRTTREAGHRGRLCGLDPAAAMLDVARRRDDVEWVLGDLTTARPAGPFELVVMTGHAFQVLLTDDAVRHALAAMQPLLAPGGRLVFETRNPAAREWTRWTRDAVRAFVADGRRHRYWSEVEAVDGDLVTFTQTYEGPGPDDVATSRSRLRFLDAERLAAFLDEAGLATLARFGDWDRSPFGPDSPEIITVARRPA